LPTILAARGREVRPKTTLPTPSVDQPAIGYKPVQAPTAGGGGRGK
jgi:hypothetical protein